jgi:hypothetical protein
MSAKTDKLELDVARWINRTSEIVATRPNTSVSFSDVWLSKEGYDPVWLEVKTNHEDNLVNPRVFFDGTWQTTYTSPSAKVTVELLNNNWSTKQFIKQLSAFAEIPEDKLKIATSKAQFKGDPYLVPVSVLKEYFEVAADNRYIANVVAYDIGALVTQDLNARNVHYLQAGDDFYVVGNENPLHLRDEIPPFLGDGDFKVRVSTRSNFSEVQAELKLYYLPKSQFSAKPDTDKRNPFI